MASTGPVLLVGVLVGMLLLSGLMMGIARTLLSVVLSKLDGRPVRIDLPVPGFPIDIVLVSKEAHFKELLSVTHRLDAVPYAALPPLFGKFFRTSRFRSELDQGWFIAFTQDKNASNARREVIVAALDKDPHTRDDVLKVHPLGVLYACVSI